MRPIAAAFAFLALLFTAQPALADNCSDHNSDVVLVTLAAQAAATVPSADQTNCNARGVIVVVDLTTTTTATVTVTIQGKDRASGKYYTLLVSAGLVANGTTVMVVYPGTTAATNVDANAPLPRTWRVNVVVANNSGTAAVTGTIGAAVVN